MDDEKLADVWMMFKEYLDKKHVEMAAERFIDLMADYGVSDETFTEETYRRYQVLYSSLKTN